LTVGRHDNGQLLSRSLRRMAAGVHQDMTDIRLPIVHGASAAPARRAAEVALRAWKALNRVDDVLLVITELVQNVTQHTDNGGELHLALLPRLILVEVADTDPLFPTQRRHDLLDIGGRGLMLVAATARTWGCRRTSCAGVAGKVVWARLPLQVRPL
jgi:hypothetical protein